MLLVGLCRVSIIFELCIYIYIISNVRLCYNYLFHSIILFKYIS